MKLIAQTRVLEYMIVTLILIGVYVHVSKTLTMHKTGKPLMEAFLTCQLEK